MARIGIESLSFMSPSTLSSSTCNTMGSSVVVLVVVVVALVVVLVVVVLVVVEVSDTMAVVELTMLSDTMAA